MSERTITVDGAEWLIRGPIRDEIEGVEWWKVVMLQVPLTDTSLILSECTTRKLHPAEVDLLAAERIREAMGSHEMEDDR